MMNVENITADFTAGTFLTGEICYLVDTSSGGVTMTLQPAADQIGHVYYVRHHAGSNSLTIDPNGSETINGTSTWVSNSSGKYIRFVSDGSNWVTVDNSSSASAGAALEDTSYNTTFTLTSDNTDQTLTGDTGDINFVSGDNDFRFLDDGGSIIAQIAKQTNHEGTVDSYTMAMYSGAYKTYEFSQDNRLLIDDTIANFRIWQSGLGNFDGASDEVTAIWRHNSGGIDDLEGTNPAFQARALRVNGGVTEKAYMNVLSRSSKGAPAVHLYAGDDDTGSPFGLLVVTNKAYPTSMTNHGAYLYFELQEDSGVSGSFGVTEQGEWFSNRDDGNPGSFRTITSEADGATAVGYVHDTYNTLSTAGAKIASWRNNTSEKAYLTKDGFFGAFHVGATGDAGGVASTIALTNGNPALGGGASATLGTIGGSGPTTAAQASWIKIYIGTSAAWIPVWT